MKVRQDPNPQSKMFLDPLCLLSPDYLVSLLSLQIYQKFHLKGANSKVKVIILIKFCFIEQLLNCLFYFSFYIQYGSFKNFLN